MPSKKQRAKAAKAVKATEITQARLDGPQSVTVAQATRAAHRASMRSLSSLLGSTQLEKGSDRYCHIMEATMMSKPGIATSTVAHGGSGSKRLLRERLRAKLHERDTSS